MKYFYFVVLTQQFLPSVTPPRGRRNATECMYLGASMSQCVSARDPHPIADRTVAVDSGFAATEADTPVKVGGAGRGRERKGMRRKSLSKETGTREFEPRPIRTWLSYQFPSSCNPFPRRRIPAVSPRDERDPLPLLFIQECGTS